MRLWSSIFWRSQRDDKRGLLERDLIIVRTSLFLLRALICFVARQLGLLSHCVWVIIRWLRMFLRILFNNIDDCVPSNFRCFLLLNLKKRRLIMFLVRLALNFWWSWILVQQLMRAIGIRKFLALVIKISLVSLYLVCGCF